MRSLLIKQLGQARKKNNMKLYSNNITASSQQPNHGWSVLRDHALI